MSEAEGRARELVEEVPALREKTLALEEELAKSKAAVTSMQLEAKVANRRNVNVIKDLKAQLKREAAKHEQAQVGTHHTTQH